jgi:hypothetical protein
MHKTPEITRLIHDNCWIVMSFAFGQPVVAKIIQTKFHGEWKYLRQSAYELSEIRADRALLEMATQMRVLDDKEGLNDYFRQTGKTPFGFVIQGDGTKTDLHFRDMTNKLIHSASFEWNLADPENPIIVCLPHDKERWVRAEIQILAIMAFVGGLML